MNKEVLKFTLGLSKSSQKSPEFAVYINATKFLDTKISANENQTEYFEFEAEISDGENNLVIEFKNKFPEDTVKDAQGKIVDDLLLNIDSIQIDEIDLGHLIWTASDYRPDYPEIYKTTSLAEGNNLPDSVKNCVNLGWNGKWILPFTSPFYIWLLENI